MLEGINMEEEYQYKKIGKTWYIKVNEKYIKVRSCDRMKLKKLYPYNVTEDEEGYAVFNYKERTCPECGKKFKPITTVTDGRIVYKESKIYCSQECRLKKVKRDNNASFIAMQKKKERRNKLNRIKELINDEKEKKAL